MNVGACWRGSALSMLPTLRLAKKKRFVNEIMYIFCEQKKIGLHDVLTLIT